MQNKNSMLLFIFYQKFNNSIVLQENKLCSMLCITKSVDSKLWVATSQLTSGSCHGWYVGGLGNNKLGLKKCINNFIDCKNNVLQL